MDTKGEKYEKCVDAEPSEETDNEKNNATSLQEKGKVFKHLNTDVWVAAYWDSLPCIALINCISSFSILSDRSKVSSKTVPPHSAI
jgi:hypothetical protein